MQSEKGCNKRLIKHIGKSKPFKEIILPFHWCYKI